MHETSLIQFALEAVEKRARSMGIDRVGEIGLVIGRLSAEPEQLQMAYDIMIYGQKMFENCRLKIDYREIKMHCRDCDKSFPSESYYQTACPACGSDHLELTEGNELYIDYFIPESG